MLEEYDPKAVADVDDWLETGFSPGPLIKRLLTENKRLHIELNTFQAIKCLKCGQSYYDKTKP